MSGRPNGPVHFCELIPIYLPGGSTQTERGVNIEAATLHIIDVLHGNSDIDDTYYYYDDNGVPQPPTPNTGIKATQSNYGLSMLTAAANPEFTTDAKWRRKGKLTSPCVGNKSSQIDCDKWPWFAAREGGPTDATGKNPRANLRMINASQNSSGGSDYSAFKRNCRLNDGQLFIVLPQPVRAVKAGSPSNTICPPL